jgi:hypothetical protein
LLSLGNGAVAVLCYFIFGENHQIGDTASNFWRNNIPLFLKKNSPNLPCRAQSVYLLATDGFNDPVQKRRQLRRKSVGLCLGILASVAATVLRKKKHKKKTKKTGAAVKLPPILYFHLQCST